MCLLRDRLSLWISCRESPISFQYLGNRTIADQIHFLFHSIIPFMSDSIEESVIKELVSDEFMRCRACNVTAPNQPTWESHKKGKR